MVTRRGWEHGPAPCCERKRPTPGRPQGSHPLILTAPALTKTRHSQLSLRSLCKGGGGVERSGDPCGRPGVGLWQLNLTPIARGKPTPLHECAGQDSVCIES